MKRNARTVCDPAAHAAVGKTAREGDFVIKEEESCLIETWEGTVRSAARCCGI